MNIDEAKVRSRVDGRSRAGEIVKLMLEEVGHLDEEGQEAFWIVVREAVPPAPRIPNQCEHGIEEGDWCPTCNADYKRAATDPANGMDPDESWALHEIGEILESIEALPSRAQDFGESCAETLRGIAETIESSGEVTVRQREAIDNIGRGVENWFHD